MGDFFDSGFDEAGASADYTVPDDDTSTHGSGIDDFDTSAHTTTTAFEADHMSQMPTVDELLHTPTSPEVPVPELDDPAPVLFVGRAPAGTTGTARRCPPARSATGSRSRP